MGIPCQRIGSPGTVLTYALLLGSVVLGLVIHQSQFAGLSPLAAKVLATGLLTLPLFFSGFAFSAELKASTNVPAALSCNLLGAMLGGFCEYNSMYFGVRSLSVFALVFYALAFAATIMAVRARVSQTAAPSDAQPDAGSDQETRKAA